MSKENISNVTRKNNINIKEFTLNFIARSFPEWVKSDGSCPRCENFYEYELENLVEVVSPMA